MNKIIKIIIIIVLIVALLVGGYFLYQFIRVATAKIEIRYLEPLEAEFNQKFHVSDFILSINGSIIDDYVIDTSSLGEKKVTYKFINDDGIKLEQSFNIKIVDTVSPLVWLNSTYTITKGDDIDVAKKILCGDNYDDNPTCKVEGIYNTSIAGEYDVKYVATDSSNNITEVPFKLIVKEPVVKKNTGVTGVATTPRNGKNFSDIITKYKTSDTEIGLDISKWQGDVDYEKLKEAGVEFVILKIGGHDKNTKERYIDSKFVQNIKKANEVGIPVGLYFYSYADNETLAKEDALWIIDQIKDYKVDLPIAFDWENWSSFNDFHLSFFNLTNVAKSYLSVLKDNGYDAMLYSSKNYLERIWFDTGYPVWLAQYVDYASYEGEYSFWQMTDKGIVPGINGYVDIDIRYKNSK